MAIEDIMVECECGERWFMDYEPTPEACQGSIWRLGINGAWGIWVDENGNEVEVE